MRPFPNSGALHMEFTLSGVDDEYADEVYYLGDQSGGVELHNIMEISGYAEQLPTGAVVEVDLLQPNGNKDTEGDWNKAAYTWDALGPQDLISLASQPGVRIRGKSGSQAGTAKADASWW